MLTRFPHVGEKIFGSLDTQSLKKCKHISRLWYNFIDGQKFPWIKIVKKVVKESNKKYSDCPKKWRKMLQWCCTIHHWNHYIFFDSSFCVMHFCTKCCHSTPSACALRLERSARWRLFGENVRRPSMRTKPHVSGMISHTHVDTPVAIYTAAHTTEHFIFTWTKMCIWGCVQRTSTQRRGRGVEIVNENWHGGREGSGRMDVHLLSWPSQI